MKLLNWDQLELLVCGNATVDLEILKSKTEYHNWPGGGNNKTVKLFWKVLESFSDDYRSLFIRFVWGRSRLPPLKIWKRTFKLVRKEGSLDNLPVAHTCFFHLDLPSYEDEEVLKQKLLTAINFGLGEFMLR